MKSLEKDRLLVRGRAYENVRVGDKLFPDVPPQSKQASTSFLGFSTFEDSQKPRQAYDYVPNIPSPEPFTVVAISTYGKNVDELNRMMTGDLTLTGANGRNWEQVKSLYTKP